MLKCAVRCVSRQLQDGENMQLQGKCQHCMLPFTISKLSLSKKFHHTNKFHCLECLIYGQRDTHVQQPCMQQGRSLQLRGLQLATWLALHMFDALQCHEALHCHAESKYRGRSLTQCYLNCIVVVQLPSACLTAI